MVHRNSNLTPRDCEEGGDGVEGTRGGRPLARTSGQPGAPPPPPVSRRLVVMGLQRPLYTSCTAGTYLQQARRSEREQAAR